MGDIDVKWLAVCVVIVAACVIAALMVGFSEPGHVLNP